MVGRKTQRQQPVVFGGTCSTLQHIGRGACDVHRHQLVHQHVVFLRDDVKVGLVGVQATFVHPVKESALGPAAVVPQGVFSLHGHHFNPSAAGWVARWEFVPRLVLHLQGQRAQAVHPLRLEGL